MSIHKVFNVRARAPLRLGLAGGGTVLSPYCDDYVGAVLNATIVRFAYAHVFPSQNGALIFRARDVGEEKELEPGQDLQIHRGLMLHKAVYQHVMNVYCKGSPSR